MQFFTKNPGQWNSREIDSRMAQEFIEKAGKLDIYPLIVHDAYLINLASPDENLMKRSRLAFIDEIQRAWTLGAHYIVTHMGAHKGAGEEKGLEILTQSIAHCLEETSDTPVTILLETTAGSGTQLGYKFSHIGHVLGGVPDSTRLGVCLDTCHVFAAGYDLSTQNGYRETFEEFDKHIGRDKLKVVHANDALKPLGSRVDRHEYIGKGQLGEDTFHRMVNDPRFAHVPFILETRNPEKMHRVYIKKLKEMMGTGG